MPIDHNTAATVPYMPFGHQVLIPWAEIERELNDLEKSGLFAVDNNQSAG
jgi:hypothetical protein